MSQRPPESPATSFLTTASSNRPGDDPIFALDAEANRRARAGENVLNATLGALMEDDGSLAILPTVLSTLRGLSESQIASYAPIVGDREFLEGVERDLFGDSPLRECSVACATPGGSGAVHTAIVHFLEPGQALLTPHLYWGPYRTFAEHTGRRVETFSMFDADGRFDVESMRKKLDELCERQGRALVILNTPCNNPTGYSLDAREWQEAVAVLRAAARRYPITLLVDIAYSHFASEGNDVWIAEVQPALGELLLLVAWTASKSFTLYGARVGALIATHPDAEIRRRVSNALAFSCRGTWSNCNHAGLLTVGKVLQDPTLSQKVGAERDRLRELLHQRVATFNSAASTAGLKYPRYEGGFFVTVFTPKAEVTASKMRESGVFVVPLSGAVRVALCSTPAERIGRLVEALAMGVASARS